MHAHAQQDTYSSHKPSSVNTGGSDGSSIVALVLGGDVSPNSEKESSSSAIAAACSCGTAAAAAAAAVGTTGVGSCISGSCAFALRSSRACKFARQRGVANVGLHLGFDGNVRRDDDSV